MAARKPVALVLLSFALALAYFSTSALAAEDSQGSVIAALIQRNAQTELHGRRFLHRSVDKIEPTSAHTFFSKVASFHALHQVDPDIPTDNAPASVSRSNDDHDYLPGWNIPSVAGEKTWRGSVASFMHATLPPPTIVDGTFNLSGG